MRVHLAAARDWLEQLEQRPGRDRILFCLDEFERLEGVVGEKPETKPQLVQLMGLLRATIQHRRRVRRLVAGNATFEELGPLWNDTFISARIAAGVLRESHSTLVAEDKEQPAVARRVTRKPSHRTTDKLQIAEYSIRRDWMTTP